MLNRFAILLITKKTDPENPDRFKRPCLEGPYLAYLELQPLNYTLLTFQWFQKTVNYPHEMIINSGR